MSSSSGSTARGTFRPATASSAVSRVRGKRVWMQTSRGSSASWRPSARACSSPRSVSGTSRVGSPLTRRSRLRTVSAWRASTKYRIWALNLDDEPLRPGFPAYEPIGRERREVDRRLATRDELGDVLADRGALLEAVPGEAGRVEEATLLRSLADDAVAVR